MRLITKLWATMLLLCVAGVANAATEYEIDQKFTTLAELDGKLFAIADETAQTAMGIGVSGHNSGWDMYFGTYTETYTSNACYYKLEAAQGEGAEGYFYLRTYKNDGSMYTAWSDAEHYGYFNSQTGQGGYFALGLEGRNGQDAKNHAVWSIEVSEGKFALKNIGTGKYLHADQLSNTYDDAFYFTFCTLKEKPNTDPLADQKDALSDAIALGKMYNALAYTDATFGTLTTKIADGETALAAEGATTESLTAATTAINDAITALAFKEGFSSLKDVPFGKWDGWGADAQQTSTYNTTWELFKTTGQSYGDSGVNDYADLSAFDKLYVTVASGTPRILLNRDADNGQWNATEAESHLIDNTVGDADSWHQKYFAKEGNVYSVDLKQLTTDKGFAHLHSIKSRDNNVVTGLFLYKAPAAAVTTEVTFDFDGGNHAASSNSSHDGDITEDEILTQDGVTMTITPSGGSTANRYWGSSPKMRMYGGTMTIVAPEGKAITKVVYNNGKWNTANTINGIVAEKGEWTGNSTNVVLFVSANTQIKNVIVTVADKNDETTTFTPAEPVHIANTAETAYTVAEAIALIDAGEALNETVFVKGIISKIEKVNVDAEDATKNYITYWISADGTEEGQQFECFKGLTMEGVAYTDIKVGATVIVKGTMKKYVKEGQDDIYEFNQNNELVSYEAPASVDPIDTAKEALATAIAIANSINPEGLADDIATAQAALTAESATVESITQAAQTLETAIKTYFGELLPRLGAIVEGLNDSTLNVVYANAQTVLATEGVTPQELAAAMQQIIATAQDVAPEHLQNLKGYAVKYGAEDAAALVDSALVAIQKGNVSQIIATMAAVKKAATPLAQQVLSGITGYVQQFGLTEQAAQAQAALESGNYITMITVAKALYTHLIAAAKNYLPGLAVITEGLNDSTLNAAYANAQTVLANENVTPEDLGTAMQQIIVAAKAVAPAHLQNLRGYAVKYGQEGTAAIVDSALVAIEAGNVSKIIATMTAVREAATPLATGILRQMIGYAQSYKGFADDVTEANAALEGGNYITMITTAKALYTKLIAAANDYVASAKAIPTEGKEGVEDLNTAIGAAEQALAAQDSDFSAINTAISNLVAAVKAFEEANTVDSDLVEIAQDQGKTLDDFARTELVVGDDYNTYTCTEGIQVAFKMFDIDVQGCDYVVVKFAEPVAAGWELAFWAKNDNSTVPVPAGATEYKYVFADDAKCAIVDDVLPQICMLHLWTGTTPLVAKVKGVYKHKASVPTGIDAINTVIQNGNVFNMNGQKVNKAQKGLYIINGKKVLVK